MPWPSTTPDRDTTRVIALLWTAGHDTAEIARRLPPMSEAQVYSVVNRVVGERRYVRPPEARR